MQKNVSCNNPHISSLLENLDIPKISHSEKDNISGPLSESEILQALKHMQNGKSPGSDGFSVDFVKLFWIS